MCQLVISALGNQKAGKGIRSAWARGSGDNGGEVSGSNKAIRKGLLGSRNNKETIVAGAGGWEVARYGGKGKLRVSIYL